MHRFLSIANKVRSPPYCFYPPTSISAQAIISVLLFGIILTKYFFLNNYCSFYTWNLFFVNISWLFLTTSLGCYEYQIATLKRRLFFFQIMMICDFSVSFSYRLVFCINAFVNSSHTERFIVYPSGHKTSPGRPHTNIRTKYLVSFSLLHILR